MLPGLLREVYRYLVYSRAERGNPIITRNLRSIQWRVCALIAVLVISGTAFSSGQKMFPDGAFHPKDPKLDASVARWYSEQLAALEEPSIFTLSGDSSVRCYRFLWLRTFHHPVSVRLQINQDGTGTVFTKVANGAGGYKPGKLMVHETRILAAAGVANFLGQVEQANYWKLEEVEKKSSGRDGAQWVIEAEDHGKYRLVDRWSPEKGPVKELGLYFLRDLARLNLKGEEIY